MGRAVKSTEARPDIDFEAWLQEEVPCGDCGNPASLKSEGHGCVSPLPPQAFKCLRCWQSWLQETMAVLSRRGYLGCSTCRTKYYSVESFSDFRPF